MEFKKYVSGIYLDKKILEEMRKSYLEFGILKLENFLKEEVYSELIKLLKDIRGVHTKIADKYSYEEMGDLSGVGRLFSSKEFLDFANFITGKKFYNIKLNISRFGHRDYTLLHDLDEKREGVEFFFIFCDEWNDKKGGHIIYTDNEENGKSLIFPVLGNSLALINKRGLGKFVKYVNHLAQDKGFILIEGSFD